MEKLQVSTSSEGELIVREGAALELKQPVKIVIEGTLKAPFDFLEQKQKNFDASEAHLLIMNSSGVLKLYLDEKKFDGTIITGRIQENPVIEHFGINTEKKWSINDLRQFIQRMSYFFDTRDEYTKMLTALQKFKASVIKVYENQNTNDGNSKVLLENKVQEHNIISTFKLNLPIYLGYEKVSFTVDIGLDVTSAETRIFLYSEGLYHLLEEKREAYIDAEIKRLNSFMEFGVCSLVNID